MGRPSVFRMASILLNSVNKNAREQAMLTTTAATISNSNFHTNFVPLQTKKNSYLKQTHASWSSIVVRHYYGTVKSMRDDYARYRAVRTFTCFYLSFEIVNVWPVATNLLSLKLNAMRTNGTKWVSINAWRHIQCRDMFTIFHAHTYTHTR